MFEVRGIPHCCTGWVIINLPLNAYYNERHEKDLTRIVNNWKNMNGTKLLMATTTDKQTKIAEVFRKLGFKGNTKKVSKTDNHGTTLNMHYLICE